MALVRNTGGPHHLWVVRPVLRDGEWHESRRVRHGDVADLSETEIRSAPDKWQPFDGPGPVDSLEPYALGAGWYQIGDRKVRGKHQALEALAEEAATDGNSDDSRGRTGDPGY